MDSLQEIKEAASQWVARRHGTEWTPANEASLQKWLSASMSHRVEYLGHEKTWRDANRLKVLGAGARPGVVPTLADWRASPYFKYVRKSSADGQTNHRQPVPRPVVRDGAGTKRGVRISAIAATVLVACGAGYLGWDHLHGPRYSTAIGVTAAVPLPDGSKVTLNTDSEIRLAVTERMRKVELRQGEAYFDVAPETGRPFVVTAGKQRIVVLGTRFSVRRSGDDLRIVVTEGKVRAGETVLTAGAVARMHDDIVTVEQRPPRKAEELLSWRDGYLMFDEVTLAEAVAEFNRYNTHKFVIADPAIAGLPVTGHFRSASVEPFARLLEQGFPVTVSRANGQIILGAR